MHVQTKKAFRQKAVAMNYGSVARWVTCVSQNVTTLSALIPLIFVQCCSSCTAYEFFAVILHPVLKIMQILRLLTAAALCSAIKFRVT